MGQTLANGQTHQTDTAYVNNVYWKRMSTIRTIIPPYFDEQVQVEIKEVLGNSKTPLALGKYNFYQDTISKIFGEYGLPSELQLIALSNTWLENDFNASSGETGMWPLPFYIGVKYGLKINSYVDERKHIIASTRATAKALADLFHIYRDWYFTIAAFSCGPVEMNKAIRMASNSMDYFTVEPFIESSHRKDLSRFMAFLYVTNYFDKHHIAPDNFILPELDTLCTPQTFSLRELATATQTPMSLMLKLNRQYRKQIVPHLPHPHCFTIPKSKTANFNAYLIKLAEEAEQKRIQDSMVRVQKLIDKFRPDSTKYQVLVMDGVLTVLDSAGKKIDPDAPIKTNANGQNATGNRWVFYTVKKGDALYLLSDLFDANLADVKRWNRLRSNTIVRGQRLKFLVPANKYGLYSSINRMSATQKQKLRRKD